MTRPTTHPTIPADFLSRDKRGQFVIWVAALNLPPTDAYRLYKDWCDHVHTSINRDDLDALCGEGFNVN